LNLKERNCLKRYYTGIGNRSTPTALLPVLTKISQILANKGLILRSGGAEGADEAFEQGCLSVDGQKEIYLPLASFRGKPLNKDGYFYTHDYDHESFTKAKHLAETFHPTWNTLKHVARMFHTRNVHQILGLDLTVPSEFVVCYDQTDTFSSGTRQALRIAEHVNIPIFNLAVVEQSQKFRDFIKTI